MFYKLTGYTTSYDLTVPNVHATQRNVHTKPNMSAYASINIMSDAPE